MSRWTVEQPWPEGTVGPETEFHDWFLALTYSEQHQILSDLRTMAAESRRCFQMDHDGLFEDNQRLRTTCKDYQEKIAALNDVIVRAYRDCQCGQTEVSPAPQIQAGFMNCAERQEEQP